MLAADTVMNAVVVRKGPKQPALRPSGYTNPDFASPDVFKISQQTGGVTAEGAANVGAVFQKVIERIQARYFIQYPAPQAEVGSFRRIRVELSPETRRRYPGAVIRAREGYYATQ